MRSGATRVGTGRTSSGCIRIVRRTRNDVPRRSSVCRSNEEMNANIDYRLDVPPFTAGVIDEFERLSAAVFGDVAPQYVSWRVASMPDVSAFLAICDARIVGFK